MRHKVIFKNPSGVMEAATISQGDRNLLVEAMNNDYTMVIVTNLDTMNSLALHISDVSYLLPTSEGDAGVRQFNLPVLPNGWSWLLSINPTRTHSATTADEPYDPRMAFYTFIITNVTVEFYGDEIQASIDWGYDEFIEVMQPIVDSLYERFSHRDEPYKTGKDALTEILSAIFQQNNRGGNEV